MCTPITSLQLVWKCLPIEFEFFKRQLNYAKYLHELPITRLVSQAFVIQSTILKPQYNSSENYWLYAAENFAHTIGLGDINTWNKNQIKQNCYDFWLNKCQAELRDRPRLKYMRDLVLPHTEKIESQDIRLDWWWRAKMGGILLSDRNVVIGLQCPLCKNNTSENIDHFLLVCSSLSYLDPLSFPWMPPWVKDNDMSLVFIRLEWLLSLERTVYERKQIGSYIQKRWKEHCEILSSNPD